MHMKQCQADWWAKNLNFKMELQIFFKVLLQCLMLIDKFWPYSIHDLQKENLWSDPMAIIQIKKSHMILQIIPLQKAKNCIKLDVI
jgi:hypothetical protein